MKPPVQRELESGVQIGVSLASIVRLSVEQNLCPFVAIPVARKDHSAENDYTWADNKVS